MFNRADLPTFGTLEVTKFALVASCMTLFLSFFRIHSIFLGPNTGLVSSMLTQFSFMPILNQKVNSLFDGFDSYYHSFPLVS